MCLRYIESELQHFNEISCMLCPDIRKQAVWTRNTPLLWRYIKLCRTADRTHRLMPTGSKYSRVDSVLGNHRCLFSQKPILSSTTSQKKSKRSIFCLIFSFMRNTKGNVNHMSAFRFSFRHWHNLLLPKNTVPKKDQIIQISDDMERNNVVRLSNPCSRFPLEKPIVPLQAKRLPAIYGTLNFIITFTRTSRGSTSWARRTQSTITNLIPVIFILILDCLLTCRHSEWSL
jgi:hypothetical protein